MALTNELCCICLVFDFTLLTLQSGDANLLAARSNRVPSFLFVEGYNPRRILCSECLSL